MIYGANFMQYVCTGYCDSWILSLLSFIAFIEGKTDAIFLAPAVLWQTGNQGGLKMFHCLSTQIFASFDTDIML